MKNYKPSVGDLVSWDFDCKEEAGSLATIERAQDPAYTWGPFIVTEIFTGDMGKILVSIRNILTNEDVEHNVFSWRLKPDHFLQAVKDSYDERTTT